MSARRWATRIGLLFGGLAAGLLLLECGFRLGAALQAPASRAHLRNDRKLDGRPIVAFIGDSNIYGVYVDPEQTLPAALERLSTRGGARGVQCFNFAMAGTPTWGAIAQAERALALHPVALVVTCGVNNYSQVPPGAGLGPLEDLRIVKVARRLLFNRSLKEKKDEIEPPKIGVGGAPVEAEHFKTGEWTAVLKMRTRDGDVDDLEMSFVSDTQRFEEIEGRMRDDLLKIAALARSAGAEPVFATYFTGHEEPFAPITKLMLSLEGSSGLKVARCADAFVRALRAGIPETGGSERLQQLAVRRGQLAFSDRHPTAIGYEVEARVVAATLRDLGVLPGPEFEDPVTPALASPAAQAMPTLRQIEDDLRFEVRTSPGDQVVVLLGPEGSSEWDGAQLPLNFWRSIRYEDVSALTTLADAEGRAVITVPPRLRGELKSPLRAVAHVSRGGKVAWARGLLSTPIEVVLKP